MPGTNAAVNEDVWNTNSNYTNTNPFGILAEILCKYINTFENGIRAGLIMDIYTVMELI